MENHHLRSRLSSSVEKSPASLEYQRRLAELERQGRMDKRQWHTNVWSIAGPDSTTSETAISAAGGKTVVVTKIVGTTTVKAATSTTAAAVTSKTTSSSSSTTSSITLSSTSSTSTSSSTVISSTTTTTTSQTHAMTITQLPSGFAVSSSSSVIASTSANSTGTALTSEKTTSQGFSTGEVMGAVVGGLVGVVALLAIIGFLYRRRNSRKTNNPAPFGDRKYRDSSVAINDKSFGGPANNYSGDYQDGEYDDFARDQVYPMSEKMIPPYARGQATTPTPSAGYAGRGAAGGYEGYNDAGLGPYQPFGAVVGNLMTPVPAIAVTTASGPRTRDLTNVGPYARSERVQFDYASERNAYQDEPRSASPTDYYGQALTPLQDHIADVYADDSRYNPFAHPDDHQERLEEDAQHRPTRTPRQSMPQLPPLSPSVFDSPLNANFGTAIPAMQQQALLQRLEPLSRSPSQVKRSEQELKKGYADLAKAAEVDEPLTPDSATRRPDAVKVEPPQMLLPPPERYQHGRPLSPLQEVETPTSTPAALPEHRNDSGMFPRMPIPADRNSPASRELPLPGRPFTPEHDGARSSKSSGSSLLPLHSGVPPSVHYPPPSPGVSLPESPSGSVAGDPRGHADHFPRGAFHPTLGSAVSLDAAYPETPDAYRFSAGTWSSPASSRTLEVVRGNQPPPQPIRYGYAVQQGPSRLGAGVEDAYGGI